MAAARPLSGACVGALILAVRFIFQLGIWGKSLVARAQSTRAPKRAAQKVSCDGCYFRVNLLCALEVAEPCATFRPHEAQLKPPQQLRLVFRQERRSRAAWAFPSAQEQAALHA